MPVHTDRGPNRVVIRTNHHRRFIVDPHELTPAERAEFDYLDWDALEAGRDYRSFIRFRGEVYDLSDCEGTFPPDSRWFYRSDSFFSGVLFRYAPSEFDPNEIDSERVICGRYFT